MIRVFRFVSVAEAISFLLLLLVAMPLKYGADAPVGVQLMGPLHGVLFMAYVGMVFLVREQLRWDLKRTVLALGAAVLPVAPFLVERYWTRTPAPAAEPQPAGRA
jgi:integral membrane protein